MRSRTSGVESPCTSSPNAATEIRPVSSETTTERQSVSSVMPIAARWRVPSVEARAGLVVSGRKQAAAAMSVLLYDHRAIVQRQAGLEDGKQQVPRDAGVQAHAALDEGAQADIALQHDQRAGLVRRKMLHRQQESHSPIRDAR